MSNKIVKVPTLMDSLALAQRLPDDIRTIREEGKVPRVHLARALGVSRREVQRWERGTHRPKEPIIAFTISSWADKIRNSELAS